MHHFISCLLRAAYAAGFGFILLLHTESIINYIPQLLGGLLMLEGLAQLLELVVLKVKTQVNKGFFLVPAITLIYSLVLILFCHSDVTDTTTVREAFAPSHGFSWTTFEMQLGGLCFVAFLISEIVIMFHFRKPLFSPEQFAEEERIRKETEKKLAEKAEKEKEEAEKKKLETPQPQA